MLQFQIELMVGFLMPDLSTSKMERETPDEKGVHRNMRAIGGHWNILLPITLGGTGATYSFCQLSVYYICGSFGVRGTVIAGEGFPRGLNWRTLIFSEQERFHACCSQCF